MEVPLVNAMAETNVYCNFTSNIPLGVASKKIMHFDDLFFLGMDADDSSASDFPASAKIKAKEAVDYKVEIFTTYLFVEISVSSEDQMGVVRITHQWPIRMQQVSS